MLRKPSGLLISIALLFVACTHTPSTKGAAGSGSTSTATSTVSGEKSGSPGKGSSPKPLEGATSSAPVPPAGNAAIIFPPAGGYSFSQSGYEEFCQPAGTPCDRHNLPSPVSMNIQYGGRTADRVVVVAKSQVSHQRYVETTSEFTRADSHVLELFTRFDFNGVEVNNDIKPDPPILALQLPWKIGQSWDGSWKASTSGTYKIEVVGQEPTQAGGRSINAYKVHFYTEYQGDQTGTSDTTFWVDPATNFAIKSVGNQNARSQFGTFKTEFQVTLMK